MRVSSRRAFFLAAIAAAPLAACASASRQFRPSRSKSGTLVRAGQDGSGHPRHVLGGLRIDAKVFPADTAAELYIVEHSDESKGGPALHVHHSQDEWFYVLDGSYRIVVGEEQFDVGPGDSVFAPRGVRHVWAHVGSGKGRLIIAFQPAGQMESFFGKLAEMESAPEPAAMALLFASHGMTMLGPPLTVS